MKVSSVEEMRAMDRSATEIYGIPELLLMENAGLASCSVIEQEIGACGRSFAVLCGSGNNGGDGFVVARKLHSAGATVRVFIFSDPAKYKGSAKTNLDILSKLPIEIARLDSAGPLEHDLLHCDAVVDALLGTGIDREVKGIYAEAIHAINHSGKTVISLDIPSGVNGDTGCVMGCAVQAGLTVTFGLPKAGNILMPGNDLCGRLFVTHISFPPELYASNEISVEINSPPALPRRDPGGYKGTFGEALFIAGASGYYGAPYLSAMSFLKAGGGYSRLACPEPVMPAITSLGSEIVFIPQHPTLAGSIAYKNKESLLSLAERMDIVIMGPGLSLDEETSRLVRELAAYIEKPLLLDGDGITAVSKDIDILKKRSAPTILTPHMGEMSRITRLEKGRIDADKIAVLKAAARDLGAVIVLKGANSLIGYPDGRVLVNISGNSGMATAGSGDVLTGTIAAMYGLGLTVEQAAAKGVFLHGAAGDLACADIGPDGMTARSVLDYVPKALSMDRDGMLDDLYQGLEII